VAATVIGAATVPSVLAVREAQHSARVEQTASAVADVLAAPGARVVRGDVVGGGTAVAVLADDRAVVTGRDLADPGDDRDYQLWVVRGDAARSAGLLRPDDGRVTALTQEYRTGDVLAITVEPAGGSEQPTTDPVVVLAAQG
jgi:anti-sigma-K factor RskA